MELLFVSPRFLFPADSGGKIRTSQILRGLKGGRFRVTLACPITELEIRDYPEEVNAVADELATWSSTQATGPRLAIKRVLKLMASRPMPVEMDYDQAGAKLIASELEGEYDIVVFDFPHSVVLAPDKLSVPSVLFTHNVESEIFHRHVEVSTNLLMRAVWRNQHRKMMSFEKSVLQRFSAVVAVSERDRNYFETEFGIDGAEVIPTGVDLQYFSYAAPADQKRLVFIGSMDWLANIDGIEYFLEEIWPDVLKRHPTAELRVIGRSPPEHLLRKAKSQNCEFTGFVDDVRDHVNDACACIIPLRVGGGTRIKAFEAMAMGLPVISTSIGVEGLDLDVGQAYLNADNSEQFGKAIDRIFEDEELRLRLSRFARSLVEANYSYLSASSKFEEICINALENQ